MQYPRCNPLPEEVKEGVEAGTRDLVFQISSWFVKDHEYGGDDEDFVQEKYLVKVFGVTEEGYTVSANLLEFPPYFFIKVQHRITQEFKNDLQAYVESKLPRSCKTALKNVKVVPLKDFWGFQNGKTWNFVRLSFTSLKGFRAGVRMFEEPVKIKNGPYIKYQLYESNIEPFLRLIHARDIQPSGWVRIRGGLYQLNEDLLCTQSQIDVSCMWSSIEPMHHFEKIAPMMVLSFDLECTSSHGDFPVAKKDYKKVANELFAYVQNNDVTSTDLCRELVSMFQCNQKGKLSKVFPKTTINLKRIEETFQMYSDVILSVLRGTLTYSEEKQKFVPTLEKVNREEVVRNVALRLNMFVEEHKLPPLEGDPIIQIGITVHCYGERDCTYEHIITLNTCESIEGVIVDQCETEEDMLLKFRDVVLQLNPDVMTGYNVLGFDMLYLRDRAEELHILGEFMKIGRLQGHTSEFVTKMLSSSALGDNILNYIDMEGRVIIDIMKVVQRDHKLDSYKLDNVANHFMKLNKHDVSPNDIFRLFKGNADDRKVIAKYCIQDCALCNKLMMKLEILANNIGMSNVCNVPLSYIFMRGQGIKIFSLVAKQCREDKMCIPSLKKPYKQAEIEDDDDENGYEGAIVLEPKSGIYLEDPVSVLDYASLYPSSMISENISHDMIVLDAQKYDNMPGLEYVNVTYDVYEGMGDKKVKVGEKVCRFVQPPNNEKGIIPRILMKLLKARKDTRKKIEYESLSLANGNEVSGIVKESEGCLRVWRVDGSEEVIDANMVTTRGNTYDAFQKAVLDGLQLAYKVTANSLYGQCGARTSPVYMKDIAACTTATGRKMILMAKKFLEENYQAKIIYGDSVTGDTPMLIRYPSGRIDIRPIETLVEDDDWEEYERFKPWDASLQHKQQGNIDAEVWTSSGWANILRVIRHQTKKQLYRVNTFQGCVDVTADHSLINTDGVEVKPTHCIVGKTTILHSYPTTFHAVDTKVKKIDAWVMGVFFVCGSCDKSQSIWSISNSDLNILQKVKQHLEEIELSSFQINTCSSNMFTIVPCETYQKQMVEKYCNLFYGESYHSKKVPHAVLNALYEIRDSFVHGCFAATGINKIGCKHKIEAQGIYYLMKSLGHQGIHVVYTNDTYELSNTAFLENNLVTSVSNIGYTQKETYVYDIETSTGVFQGGVGSIICKNTDSLFSIFPNKDANGVPLKGKEAITTSIQTAITASKEFKKLIKHPHDLEYEKTFWPFILLSKKKYLANKYEFDAEHYKQASMGVVLQRRDNAPIVKTIYGGVINTILNERNVGKSLNFLKDNLTKLINGQYPLEELVITKSLKATYADPTRIAHKVLADRMKERDEGSAPQTNDRVPFIYIQVDAKKKAKMLQGERIEHPTYIKEHNLTPDYEFYLTNQVMNPLLQLYALVVESLPGYNKGSGYFENMYKKVLQDKEGNEKKAKERIQDLKEKEVENLLFTPYLLKIANKRQGTREITDFFPKLNA